MQLDIALQRRNAPAPLAPDTTTFHRGSISAPAAGYMVRLTMCAAIGNGRTTTLTAHHSHCPAADKSSQKQRTSAMALPLTPEVLVRLERVRGVDVGDGRAIVHTT